MPHEMLVEGGYHGTASCQSQNSEPALYFSSNCHVFCREAKMKYSICADEVSKACAGVQGYPTFSRPPPDAPPPPPQGGYGEYGGAPAPQLRPPAPQPSLPSAAPTTRSVPLEKVLIPYCYPAYHFRSQSA